MNQLRYAATLSVPQAVTLSAFIGDVPGSNIGRVTSYPDTYFMVYLSPSRQLSW
jgi:hypothetical protein